MASNINFKGDKLVGRSNYIEWAPSARLFLEINGFMPYIDNSEAKPDKTLYYEGTTARSPELAVKYYEKESEYTRNSKRALGAIKSIISLDNIKRFKDKTSPSELWEAIISTFGETSLELIGRYLNKLIEADYSSFNSIDEYTSQIQASSIYLKEMNYEVPKPFIVYYLFKGLPSSFESFISRKYEELAKDLSNIDISRLIADLISEEGRLKSNIDLEASRASKIPICKHCKKKGHIEDRCFRKYPELRTNTSKPKAEPETKPESSKVIMSIFKPKAKTRTKTESSKVIISSISSNYKDNKIVLDSGATEHYSPNRQWFIDFKETNNQSITIANGTKMSIKGIGSIPIIANNQEIVITNINYIPKLRTTLISPKELTKKGWSIIFKDNKAKISHNSSNITIVANWDFNAYYLDVLVNERALEPIVYKVDPSSNNTLDLYHKRLGHINQDYLNKTI